MPGTDPYAGQNTYNGVDYGPAPNNGEGFTKNVGGNELAQCAAFHGVAERRIHGAGVGGLGSDAAQRFLLAIAELRARVQ